MKLAQLGDLVSIKGGGTPDKKNPTYWEGGTIPWATVKDFGSTEIASTIDRITPEGVANSATQVIPAGNILVPTRMAVGKAAINTVDLAINQDLKALIPNQGVDKRYLLHALIANGGKLERQAGGATVKGITLPVLRSLEIPLPPLEEQKRIAAILDQADSLRHLRQRAIDRLNSLGQAIFYEMFPEEDYVINTTLADFTDIQVGYPFKSSEYTESNESVRLCRGANVLPSRIDWNDTARWPLSKLGGLQEFHLKEGDTVIAMDRPWISSGFKVAQISAEDLPALLVQRVARIRPRQSVHKSYIFFRINSRNFEKFCSPTETTIPHISPNEVKNFPIPVPTASMCEQFDKAIERLSVLKRTAMIGQQTVDRFFYSLQHRVFQGEL